MTPAEQLEKLFAKAESKLSIRELKTVSLQDDLNFVCRYTDNRAPVRLLLACLLAKVCKPAVDPRKPYTEIGGVDSFSGRAYDEKYVTGFISRHRLPCNSTTAFLTPAFRNFNRPLTVQVEPNGRPKELYTRLFRLLDTVAHGNHSAKAIITDALRVLIDLRNERLEQLERLQANLKQNAGPISLSTEEIVTLLRQHLDCRGSSRLPVLMIAAAYDSVGARFGEIRKPLHAHTAADEQTGSFGDVEIVIQNEDQVRTAYEMKQKRITLDDIDRAVQKIGSLGQRIDNYLFVTTVAIEPAVDDYARSQFDKMGGTEVAIVDCLGFLRHFLHWFHRHRIAFLNAYQVLLLAEPDNTVSVPLKAAFLSLRQAAESEA